MDIIIFALIAFFLFYRLYLKLGENDSVYQSKNKIKDITPVKQNIDSNELIENSIWSKEIRSIREYDLNFTEKNFLTGATKVYELIFSAYNTNDHKAIESLTSNEVYQFLKKQIDSNTEKTHKSILSISNTEITDISLSKNIATIEVEFICEQMITRKPIDAPVNSEIINTKDKWSFMRDLSSESPNWLLVKI